MYPQNKKLAKELKQIEESLERNHRLASEIKEDTEKIVLDVEWVVILSDRQMARIDDLESYMKDNLGSDWTQLKYNWQEYREGDITRLDFTKEALKKLGKRFLGIFVSTS